MKPSILHAYDATDVLIELYNTEQPGSRDTLDTGVNLSVPTIANGKVYIGTISHLAVFGLLSDRLPHDRLAGVCAVTSTHWEHRSYGRI